MKIIMIIIIAILMIAVWRTCAEKIDKQIASECRHCNATYGWCDSYWKEKGFCKYEKKK